MADPILTAVGKAIALTRSDPASARAKLTALWALVGGHGDPLHRCAIAHAMADVCDSIDDELEWDLRALDAGILLDDARLTAAGMASSTREMLVSLHLNLADAYRRLGNATEALAHVSASNAAITDLPHDAYTDMIRQALSRITASLPS